jgi:hypothetical protein
VRSCPPSTWRPHRVILTRVGGRPNRISIPDARGQGASLRVTRHPPERKIVLSHWRDGVCVASTPIELSEVSALIGVLADALGDAVGVTDVTPTPASAHPSIISTVRNWFRPKLAQITELRLVRNPAEDTGPIDRTEGTDRT